MAEHDRERLILTVTVILCYIIAMNYYVGAVFQSEASAWIAAEKFSGPSELPGSGSRLPSSASFSRDL